MIVNEAQEYIPKIPNTRPGTERDGALIPCDPVLTAYTKRIEERMCKDSGFANCIMSANYDNYPAKQ